MTARIPDPESELENAGIPDLSDALPSKEITGDAQEELPAPGEFPVAVDDFGTTAAETRAGEPLAQRLAREEPDVGADTRQTGTGGGGVGRLVAERESGTNKEQDTTATDVGADGGGLAPEERAMHEESPPA